FFNVIHDGLRQRQLPRGSLVADLVPILHHVVRQDFLAVFQDDFVRACGCCRQQYAAQQARDPCCAPPSLHFSILNLRGAPSATALFLHAEYDYTLCVKLLSACLLLLASWPATCRASDLSPRDLLASLNALSLDSQSVYTVSTQDHIEIRHGDAVLTFQVGRFAFYAPFEGRITGFVFSGLGHALSLPRDPAEKQQMARFLGTPVLDQQFVSAFVRFTDDTAKDLLAQFQRAGLQPSSDPSFAAVWEANVARLNSSHSLRILFEEFSSAPRHFFHAGIDGVLTGPFDVLADEIRSENFMIGQPRFVGILPQYDV